MEEQKKSNSKLWGIVALVLVVLGFGAYKMGGDKETTVNNSNDNTGEQNTNSVYKDGNYSALGEYTSPGGAEQINVTLTLKGDVVTDATVKSLATLPASQNWQNAFINGFKTMVVGKKLDEVNLDKVSGSSLTPKGWNDAISKIKTQARS